MTKTRGSLFPIIRSLILGLDSATITASSTHPRLSMTPSRTDMLCGRGSANPTVKLWTLPKAGHLFWFAPLSLSLSPALASQITNWVFLRVDFVDLGKWFLDQEFQIPEISN